MIKRLLLGLLLSLSVGQAWADITSNLVAHWTFDAGTGTTAADATGNGHTATFVGTPAWVAGKVGAFAIRFNDTADAMTLSTFSSGTVYTIACWIYSDLTSDSYGPLLASVSGGSGFSLFNNDLLDLYYGTELQSTTSVTHNVWQHVAVVVNGASTTFYIDGVAAGTTAAGGGFTVGSIGKGSGAEAYQGSMDDLRIYSRALILGDIGELVALGAVATPKRRLLLY
jgi:hypothetical protein